MDIKKLTAHESADASKVQETIPSFPPQKVAYTEYAQLPDEPGYSYELIEGVLIKEPSPIIHHQRVTQRLLRILEDYFAEANPTGEVFVAPLDVVLSEYTVVQPDLIYVPDMNLLGSSKFVDIAPELVVEVLSPSSSRRDRIKKIELYRQHGIPHYWIVDPDMGIVEIYKLAAEDYAMYNTSGAKFEHTNFPGLTFNIADICSNPLYNPDL